jgi:hypothetical protein
MKWSIMVGAIRSATSEPLYQHQISALFAAPCAALGLAYRDAAEFVPASTHCPKLTEPLNRRAGAISERL